MLVGKIHEIPARLHRVIPEQGKIDMGGDVFCSRRLERIRVSPVTPVATQGSSGPVFGKKRLPAHPVVHGQEETTGDSGRKGAQKRTAEEVKRFDK